ncbi:MAG: D-aminoacylase [Oscillospiraceae bacterium]|nr:D-aminoacylase [Oscillospiraceae bacterium]
MLDMLIINGTIIDGSGTPAFKGCVGVKDGKITAANGSLEAVQVIDASGKIVCPGFIDAHSHGDKILGTEDGRLFKTAQGITTELCGNCGSMRAPISSERTDQIRNYYSIPEPIEEVKKWSLFENYLRYAESLQLSANVRFYAGHNILRMSAMGLDNRPASSKDMDNMRSMLREAMEAGSAGLSTGLIYTPGCFSEPEEIIELAKVIAPFNGIYGSHMRNESFALTESVKEVIDVGKAAGVRLNISHYKVMGKSNWGNYRESYELIQNANDNGMHITCDQYPYTRNMTNLYPCMPPWYFSDGKSAMANRLKDRSFREKVRKEMEDPSTNFDNFYLNSGGWDGVYISYAPKNPESEGLYVTEYADKIGNDPWNAYFDLMVENECLGDGVYSTMCEDDLCDIIKAPFCVVGTDGYTMSWKNKGHPRASSSFPHAINYFVKEKGVLSLEQMINKMTGLTAERLMIANKGLIREGYDADIVILDYDNLKVLSTYSDPNRKTEGIDYVIVGGKIVYKDLDFTGTYSGKVIRYNK